MSKWIIGLGLVLLFSVVAIAGVMTLTTGEPVDVAIASRQTVRQFIDERGITRLPQRHLITMPFGGRIEEVALDVNDSVQASQVVARLVAQDLQLEVDEAAAVVARLDSSIKENEDKQTENLTLEQTKKMVDAMLSTVEAARNRMRSSEKRAAFAEQLLANAKTLASQGARSAEAVERLEVERVDADVKVEEDRLTVEIMNAYLAATQIMPKMVLQYMADQTLQQAVLTNQKAEAEARLRQIQTRQQRGEMQSPVDGVVLKRHVQNERYLAAGEVLMEIGELDRLQVEADVLSQDVVSVRVGQTVEIYGPAVGGNIGSGVAGVVARIHPAGFTKTSSLGVEEQRVKVVIDFAPDVLDRLRQQHQLGVDFRVRVRIFTAEAADAVAVPRSALFRDADGDWQAFVVRGRAARQTPVEVGLMNDQFAQIIEGIDEQDAVVLAPPTSLTDGTRVRTLADSE